jgi:hypothetical protein
MATDPTILLKRVVAANGQAAVARALGYSASALSQALSGSYGGSLENMLQRVSEVYGDGTVRCPVMGEVLLSRCAEERRKPFCASNPQRVRLYRACQGCTEYRGV